MNKILFQKLQEIEKLKQDTTTMTSQISRLENENHQLHQEFTSSKQKFEAQHSTLQTQISVLSKENAALKEDNSRMKIETVTLSTENQHLQQLLLETKAQISQYNHAAQKLEQNNAELTSDNTKLLEALHQRTLQVTQLEQSHQSYHTMVRMQQKQIHSLTRIISQQKNAATKQVDTGPTFHSYTIAKRLREYQSELLKHFLVRWHQYRQRRVFQKWYHSTFAKEA